jgi:cell division septum initiation protein DivIVA
MTKPEVIGALSRLLAWFGAGCRTRDDLLDEIAVLELELENARRWKARLEAEGVMTLADASRLAHLEQTHAQLRADRDAALEDLRRYLRTRHAD